MSIIRVHKREHSCVLVEEKEVARLQEEHNELLRAVQQAYRKHHLSDDRIGWDGLGHTLLVALDNAMGVDARIKWAQQIHREKWGTNDE